MFKHLRWSAILIASSILAANAIAALAGEAKSIRDEIARLGGKLEMSGEQIVKIDLSRSKITNDDLAMLADRKELRELDLRQTGIDDTGLVHLKALSALKSLNLFRNPISNAASSNSCA